MRFAVHAVYYDERKTDLIRDCLLPAASRLAESDGVRNVYLQRHWKHGPHVRLCVRADDGWSAEPEIGAAGERIETYMREHPSRTLVDPDHYRALSVSLDRRELVPPPYEPIWPDNSLVVGEYDAGLATLGSETTVRFKEDVLGLARAALAVTLDAIRGDESSRLEYVFRILLMAACSYPDGGLVRGHLSYRSHVEDFLFDHDDGSVRRAFEGRSRAVASRVDGIVAQLVEEVTHGRYVGSDPVLRAWWAVVDHAWKTGLALARDGVITGFPDSLAEAASSFDKRTRDKWDPPGDRAYSPFHTKLQRLQVSRFPASVGFTSFPAYRWIVNLLYSCLPLLDVSPTERYCIAFIIAEAAERHFDVTWETILDDVQAGRVPDVIQQIRSQA